MKSNYESYIHKKGLRNSRSPFLIHNSTLILRGLGVEGIAEAVA